MIGRTGEGPYLCRPVPNSMAFTPRGGVPESIRFRAKKRPFRPFGWTIFLVGIQMGFWGNFFATAFWAFGLAS